MRTFLETALVRGAMILSVALAASPAVAQDTDGDGVLDASDALPCDVTASALVFVPAEDTQAMVMFEDRWPSAGDLDFNDAVIAYNYVLQQNAAGNTVRLRATFDVLALGGTIPLGAGLHLKAPRASVGAITRTLGSSSPEDLVLSSSDNELTVQLSTDLRELFGNSPGPINSQSTTVRTAALRLVLDVTFSTPVSLVAADLSDLYVFHTGKPSHEIHRSEHAGTSAMATNLFNTGDDASQTGRSFVEASGIPFAIALPELAGYPGELTPISSAFPDITQWAASGGTSNADFYLTNVQSASVYTDANGNGPLTPGTIDSVVDTTCVVTQGSNSTFRVNDLSGDDVASAALFQFFSGLTVSQTDWLYFSVSGPATNDGAWCATRADWYVSNYLSLSQGGSSATSGSWEKWHRAEAGMWQGPVTAGQSNIYGSSCDGNPYSWCSEWGLAGRYLGIMPGNLSNGETYASGWSSGAGWTLEIRVGTSFEAACNNVTGPNCTDGVQNQNESGVDCGGACGACPTCSDGIQNQGETGVDCGGQCSACPVSPTSTFTFLDGTGDDQPATALRDFFNGLSVGQNEHIFFEVSGPSGSDGAWCSTRADWYVSNYLSSAGTGGASATSGGWDKWHRTETGSWSAAVTSGQSNIYGTSCDGNAWSWCSEWGLGGRYLGSMLGNATNGETYASGWSSGAGWTLTIRVGGDRNGACGF